MTYRGCRIIAAGCAARIDGQFRLARDALPFRLPLDLNRHFALRMAGLHHAVCNLGTRAGQIGIDLAQQLYAEVGGPLAGAYPMGKVWMMHSGEGFALVRAPPEALRAAFAGLFLPAPDRTLAGFF